ncbi:Aste57867_4483 [Aphanomyces stellatus]|uniref:Aste57867_4483 protein n=1 Tax=Aphanomyces stellatus TaxID=120398 RepID=A0A485KBG5_9STRA|nr:hypothetical protein As57867_004471 [Aphanomyces stellatus]VFT81593.1 Aste57867_4483 [Aphanomyces stellatus]
MAHGKSTQGAPRKAIRRPLFSPCQAESFKDEYTIPPPPLPQVPQANSATQGDAFRPSATYEELARVKAELARAKHDLRASNAKLAATQAELKKQRKNMQATIESNEIEIHVLRDDLTRAEHNDPRTLEELWSTQHELNKARVYEREIGRFRQDILRDFHVRRPSVGGNKKAPRAS